MGGRSYLLSQPELVPRLCDLLMSEEVDSLSRQNALGALHNLSPLLLTPSPNPYPYPYP